MDNSKMDLKKVRMYCPNCGQVIVGYCARDETLRIECNRCMSKIFSKRKDKRTISTKIVEPVDDNFNQSSSSYFTI